MCRPFGPYPLYYMITGAFGPGKGSVGPSGLMQLGVATIRDRASVFETANNAQRADVLKTLLRLRSRAPTGP